VAEGDVEEAEELSEAERDSRSRWVSSLYKRFSEEAADDF
jgi:hypothetical protein